MMELTNFYKDYVFNPDDFDEIQDMLNATVEKINQYLVQLNDLRIGGELEDFRIMPVQYVNIMPALYDTGVIFDSEELRVWNNPETTLSAKTEMLYSKGKYIRFTADRGFLNDAAADNKIIDFKLYDPNGRRLVYNVDYVFKNNLLYLFDYSSWDPRNGVHFKLTDIAIDFNTVDDMLGKNLCLSYDQEKISKSEFNKIVRKLTLSATKGSEVAAIKNSILELGDSEDDTVRVVDKATADPELAALWRDIFANKDAEAGLEIHSGTLSPFDFLIYYPVYFSDYKVKLLKEYLDKVKHAYTNYSEFAYEPTYTEEYLKNIAYDWFDIDLRPYLENKGLVISDGEDEILYTCQGEIYYYNKEAGEVIDLIRIEYDENGKAIANKIFDNNGVWVKEEDFVKEFECTEEDNYASVKPEDDIYEKGASVSSDKDDYFVHYALLNYRFSRTNYNMILY